MILSNEAKNEAQKRREREKAKEYFLEAMMLTDGKEHDRNECIFIQIINGLDYCSDEDGDE